MKLTFLQAAQSVVLLLFTLLAPSTRALEFGTPFVLLSEASEQESLKYATGLTLSDHRAKRAGANNALRPSGHLKNSRKFVDNAAQTQTSKQLLDSHMDANATAGQGKSSKRVVDHAKNNATASHAKKFKRVADHEENNATRSQVRNSTPIVDHAESNATAGHASIAMQVLVAQNQRNVSELGISTLENMSQQLSNGTVARDAPALRGGLAVALKVPDQTALKDEPTLSNSAIHQSGSDSAEASLSQDASAPNMQAISLLQEDEKSLLSHARAVSKDAQASWKKAVSPTLPRAPLGHHWVIQDTSDKENAPLLSEYVPDSHDTYVDLPGSPWKLVKSPKAASLVVQLMGMDAWKKQVDDKIRKDTELSHEKSLLSHAKAVSNDAQTSWKHAERSTLPLAPSGHHWVIQDTSDKERAPLLSEYVPDPHDTYVDLPGSPWKLVKSSKAASLVVELIGMDAWKRQLEDKIRKDKVLFRVPFSTRKIQPPPWLASVAAASGFFEKKVAKPLNATAATGQAALEVAEESPFLLQHVMPVVFVVRDIPSWFAQRLKKMAAKVTEMGLVTAQILCSTVMLGVLLVFIIIDKGLQVCRGTDCDETNGALHGEEYWRQQLTSWEAMPGVGYNEIMGDS